MVDWVKCVYKLPDRMAQGLTFKTYDLRGLNLTYEISCEGQLFLPRYDENHNFSKRTGLKWNGTLFIHGYAHYIEDIHFGYQIELEKGLVKKLTKRMPLPKESTTPTT